MLKLRIALLPLVVLSLINIGCSRSLVQSHSNTGSTEPPRGITYYLPRNLLKVVVVRQQLANDNAAKKAEAAKEVLAAAASAKKRAAEAKGAAEHAKRVAEVASTSVVVEAKRNAELLAAEAQVAVSDADAANKAAIAALAEARAAAAAEPKEYADDISIAVMPLEPDTAHRYIAQLNHKHYADDKLTITTNEAGLLQTVDTSSTDRTPKIVADLAEIAISIYKIAAGVPIGAKGAVPEAVVPPKTVFCSVDLQLNAQPKGTAITIFEGIETKAFSYEQVFDPSDAKAVNEINLKLCQLATLFQLDVRAPTVASTPAAHRKLMNGLVYRRQIPFTVNLLKKISNTNLTSYSLKSTNVMLPNGAPISILPLDAGMFVATEYKTEFKNGMMTKLDATRPSETAGFVAIPLNIVQRLLALPTELLQLKINYNSKDSELLASEKKVIEAQQALKEAREAQQKAAVSGGLQ